MTTNPRQSPAKRAGKITTAEIERATRDAKNAGADVWLTDPGARGEGRFMVRCTPAGARIGMYRYTKPDGTRDTLRVGTYDADGRNGLTLTELRRRAGEWARLLQGGVRDLREHFAAQEQAERTAREIAERQAARGTLQALLDAYVATLGDRPSAKDARLMFARHVAEAFPELASKPAAEIQPEQLRDVLARLIEAGKGRTAGKLRSYLRAAFALASRARLDPAVPGAFAAFDVTANPADRLPALAQFNGTRNRALTLPELRAFWTRLTALPAGAQRDAVMACVLLGGQRPAQLLRATAADLDLSAGTLQLLDPKGRNRASKPRRHVVPLVADLLPVMKHRRDLCAAADTPLFSMTGDKPLTVRACGDLVIRLCDAMAEAGELERGPFRLCDLRRTAETHLAALGVSSDVRAQIQSHGLHGVQIRHYDRHDYDREKRAALALWADRLYGREAQAGADVVPLRGRGKAGVRAMQGAA
jgi:integrase